MYLRHTRVRKNGRTHTYWRLARSVRVGRKVRQETVAYLGELFDVDYGVIFCDITGTCFEGLARVGGR